MRTRGKKTAARARHMPRISSCLLRYLRNRRLEKAYRRMATDVEREKEALEWSEGTLGDVASDL